MERKIDFVACDMPSANAFMINVYAAVAQEERRMIKRPHQSRPCGSQGRGVKFGGPRAQSTKRDRRAPWNERGPLRRFSWSWLECRPAPWLRS